MGEPKKNDAARRREAGALVQQAVELYFRGHYEQAVKLLDVALELDPEAPRPYVAKAMCLAELGDPRAGYELAEKALQLDPSSGIGYTARALCRRRTRDPEGAMADYEKALEASPDDFRVYYNFACFWAERGEEGECRKYLKHALDLAPQTFADIAAQDPDLARYSRTEWFRELVAEVKRRTGGGGGAA